MEEKGKEMKKVMMALTCVLLLVSLAIAGEKIVYTVKKGDTLGQLMFTWKVQGVDIKQIHKWNPDLGTQISVGQQIEYYLPDQPSPQKISAEEIKKIVDETIAAQKKYVPTAQPQASIFRMALYLGATALVVLLLNSLIDRWSRRKKAEKTKAQEKESPKQPDQSTTKWVEVDGYSVIIEVDYVDGEKRFYSPFTNASGLQIYGPSEPKLISSLRRCLKPDSEFSEQVKSLKEARLIRPLL